MANIFSLTPSVTVSQLLRTTVLRQFAELDSARLDAELLLAHCMGVSRVALHTYPERQVGRESYQHFQRLVARRREGEPMAYLLGEQEFWSLKLKVTKDVLIPRPETEHVVEAALERIRYLEAPRVLELGTGSGAIALALAYERRDAEIVASDASENAIRTAQENAMRLELNRICFLQSDWYKHIPDIGFDLVVSNPPYIRQDDPHLKEGSLPFEPMLSLSSGKSGLEAFEHIISNASRFLNPEGWLVVEHGYDQKASLHQLFAKNNFINLTTRQDLAGIDRVYCGQKKA